MLEKNKITILSMNNFFDCVIHRLASAFDVVYPHSIEDNKFIQGAMTTPWTTITGETIKQLPNLKIISCFGTGIDSVDSIMAKENKIIITNTPDVVTEDTADIAITLLLCLSRNIIINDQFAKSGQWKVSSPPLGKSPQGKNLGIVGLGKIGKRIAEKAIQFGLSIAYHGRHKQNVPYQYFNNLIEMAENSDYLIVSCTGGEGTKNIINIDTLNALGQSSYLINVSRGSTINESDLIYALENNIIAGIGLDVYQNEPNIPEPLLHMKNVVLLPHIGTATEETRIKMLNMVIDNIISYFTNSTTINPVNY
ncbi:MAG: 2-hydroxyacid dehydrogenase [Gammaproteobacteria bacterium]|nr:2-hydroxyacid dehydrogenase [Gammaproteobacteria bacterium]